MKMKSFLSLIILINLISCHNSPSKEKTNETDDNFKETIIPKCNFVGGFSDKQYAKEAWISIDKNNNYRMSTGGNGVLVEENIQDWAHRYGDAINNIACLKTLDGEWALIIVNKREKPFDANTDYYLDQGFLRPLYKIK